MRHEVGVREVVVQVRVASESLHAVDRAIIRWQMNVVEPPGHDASPVVRSDQFDTDVADGGVGPTVGLLDIEAGSSPRRSRVADDQGSQSGHGATLQGSAAHREGTQ